MSDPVDDAAARLNAAAWAGGPFGSDDDDFPTCQEIRVDAGESFVAPTPIGRITFTRSGIYLIGPSGATWLRELPNDTFPASNSDRCRHD